MGGENGRGESLDLQMNGVIEDGGIDCRRLGCPSDRLRDNYVGRNPVQQGLS
jgi:hypothetical protein